MPAGSPPAGEGGNYRPKWLPEKYKTAEDFRAGYDNLTTSFTKKTEDLRKEIETGLLKERPEAADKYELPTFDEKLGVDAEAIAKHPLVGWWRETAFKRGHSNAEFQEGIAKYIEALRSDLPDETEERKKLGENASARIEAVSLWAGQTFSEEEWGEVNKLASTAAGFKALERIMKGQKQLTPPNGGDPVIGRPDEEAEILALMNKPEYYHPTKRDPAVVQRVEKFFKIKYAGQKQA